MRHAGALRYPAGHEVDLVPVGAGDEHHDVGLFARYPRLREHAGPRAVAVHHHYVERLFGLRRALFVFFDYYDVVTVSREVPRYAVSDLSRSDYYDAQSQSLPFRQICAVQYKIFSVYCKFRARAVLPIFYTCARRLPFARVRCKILALTKDMDGSPSLLRLRVKAYGLQADRVDGGNAAASLWKGERLHCILQRPYSREDGLFLFSADHTIFSAGGRAPPTSFPGYCSFLFPALIQSERNSVQ